MRRRKCFFYMIIYVSVTQRHRCMVLRITRHFLSHSQASPRTLHNLLYPSPITIPYSRESRARYSTSGDKKRMTRKRRNEEISRGCASGDECGCSYAIPPNLSHRYHYYILTDAFLLLHYIVCC